MSTISKSKTNSKRSLSASLLQKSTSANNSAAAAAAFSATTTTSSYSSSTSKSSPSVALPITTAVARARAVAATATDAHTTKRRRKIETLPDTTTENGAPAFSSSGDARLDLFFSGFVRDSPREKIVPMLHRAWRQSPEDTVRLILQSRDARSGKGERACSLIAWLWLREFAPVTYCLNLPRFLEVGYFKDLLSIVVEIERNQSESMPRLGEREVLELEVMADYLLDDVRALENRSADAPGPRVTLVGKWVPTEGTHFDKKANGGLARRLARLAFGETDPKCYSKKYRQSVSALRKHLVVVERLMCAKQWEKIEFGKCPSQCHNRNKNAFIKHCGERYQQYISRVKKGTDKINTAGLQPHELVKQCMSHRGGGGDDVHENARLALETVEAQWTELIAKLRKSGTLSAALSIVDVSGSMSGIPMEVAMALGLVVADLTEGAFHNRLLTFSANPQWHVVEEGASLQSKVKLLQSADWGMNTDLLKTFTMILDVAKKNKVAAADLPKTLFIFSDMQFDAAQSVRGRGDRKMWETTHRTVQSMYSAAGYVMPSIVYWNLQGKATTFPVDQYAENVACVAGFSAELLKLFLKGVEMSPLAVLQSALESYEVDIEESER